MKRGGGYIDIKQSIVLMRKGMGELTTNDYIVNEFLCIRIWCLNAFFSNAHIHFDLILSGSLRLECITFSIQPFINDMHYQYDIS